MNASQWTAPRKQTRREGHWEQETLVSEEFPKPTAYWYHLRKTQWWQLRQYLSLSQEKTLVSFLITIDSDILEYLAKILLLKHHSKRINFKDIQHVFINTDLLYCSFPELKDVEAVCSDCSSSPPWVTYLCVAFGILFLVMLIINILLCSAMTCSCAKSSVDGDSTDKEPSVIEEFDPYTRSWHGSQYGSR